MIKILPLKNDELLAELNEKENTTARLAYCLQIDDIIEGYILYNLNENEGLIRAINASDDAVADGLVRAVFASLYDFGINSVCFSQEMDNDLLVRLSFVKKGEWKTPSIENILYSCKNCKK